MVICILEMMKTKLWLLAKHLAKCLSTIADDVAKEKTAQGQVASISIT